jgi:hypothetical protein
MAGIIHFSDDSLWRARTWIYEGFLNLVEEGISGNRRLTDEIEKNKALQIVPFHLMSDDLVDLYLSRMLETANRILDPKEVIFPDDRDGDDAFKHSIISLRELLLEFENRRSMHSTRNPLDE